MWALRSSRLSELTDLLDLSHKQIQEMEADRTTTTTTATALCAPRQNNALPVAAPMPPPEDDPAEMIYCSVDELREWSKKKEEENKCAMLANNAINSLKSDGRANNYSNAPGKVRTTGRPDRDVLHEISLNNKVSVAAQRRRLPVGWPTRQALTGAIPFLLQPAARVPKVAQRVAQWERRVLETRTEQILTNLKQRQEEAAREAEEMAPAQERLWQEQGERRAEWPRASVYAAFVHVCIYNPWRSLCREAGQGGRAADSRDCAEGS